jgi:hypothetical protein
MQKGKGTKRLKKDPCKAPAKNLDFVYLNVTHISSRLLHSCVLKILKWKNELRKRKYMIREV